MSKDDKYVVRLDAEEQVELQSMVDEGRRSKSVRQLAGIRGSRVSQAIGEPAVSQPQRSTETMPRPPDSRSTGPPAESEN